MLEKIETGIFKFAEAFPDASGEGKQFFSQREGWNYSPEPNRILFRDYVQNWMAEIWSGFDSETKKDDYKQDINAFLLPYFGDMCFRQITSVEIKKFVSTLKLKKGPNKGQKLSRSRIGNILIPFKAIWNDACDQHQWNLPDPFRFTSRHLPKRIRKSFEVLRFDDWMRVVGKFDPAYRNVAEIMIMTGMIASEIAGLRKEDIREDKIHIANSISRKREKATLKTEYRVRTFPITKALRSRLDLAITNANGKYLFRSKDGGIFEGAKFRKGPLGICSAKSRSPVQKTLYHSP